MNDVEFEIPKIFWGGAHRAPPQCPSRRSFSGFALDSGMGPRFGLRPILTPLLLTRDGALAMLTRFATVYVQHPLNESAKNMCPNAGFCKKSPIRQE